MMRIAELHCHRINFTNVVIGKTYSLNRVGQAHEHSFIQFIIMISFRPVTCNYDYNVNASHNLLTKNS